jgi:hypothetical protein
VNWKLIARCALYLLFAQFVVGLLDGLFTPVSFDVDEGLLYFFMGVAAHLLASAGVFFALSMRHHSGRWARAALVLLVYVAASLAIDQLSAIWLERTPIVLSAMGWLLTSASALVGTVAGGFCASRAAVAAYQTPRQDA